MRRDDEKLERLIFEARSYAARKGLLMHPGGGSKVRVTPFTLLSSPMRRSEFEDGFEVAPIYARLMLAAARDEELLRRVLRPAAACDDFLTRLLELLDVPKGKGTRIQCTVNRYDFFVGSSARADAGPLERGLRLVEVNCTAAGAPMEADALSAQHRFIGTHPAAVDARRSVDARHMPENGAVACVADVLAQAHRTFVAKHGLEDADVRSIMVVSPPHENICDQDAVRERLWRTHGIDMPRVPLLDVAAKGEVVDSMLVLRGAVNAPPFTVAAAYFRCGYGPEDYGDVRAWDARRVLESSSAVCVPSAAMQLAGTKKMLQALSNDALLQQLVGKEDAARISRSMVKQWGLEGEEGAMVARMAMEDADDYVLKPQRDGNGANLFRNDIVRALKDATPDERAQYVLQQRIHPHVCRNVVVREDSWEEIDVVREFGIFGGALMVDDVLVVNNAQGHVTRSKKAGVDGGGICTGVAFMDSPQLQDEV